jgi:tRNA(fMet)-specific endonuclease VapC
LIHVDATFVIDFLRETQRKRRGPASDFLASTIRDDLVISVFVACELFAGVHASQRSEEERERVQRFCTEFRVVYPDERCAETFGWLSHSLQRSGQMIGTMDVLIASLALIEGAPLVTRNVKHFKRIPNLEIISY